MTSPNYPVRILSAGYGGGQPCTRCGNPVTDGHRVSGTKGPDVVRYLILCPACYRVFQQLLQTLSKGT